MPAYPTTPGKKVDIKPVTTRRYKITEAGTVRGSSLSAGDAYQVTVVHPWITTTEMGTLQTWYDTNKDADNTIVVDSDTYDINCEADFQQERHNATYLTATIRFFGTRQ